MPFPINPQACQVAQRQFGVSLPRNESPVRCQSPVRQGAADDSDVRGRAVRAVVATCSSSGLVAGVSVFGLRSKLGNSLEDTSSLSRSPGARAMPVARSRTVTFTAVPGSTGASVPGPFRYRTRWMPPVILRVIPLRSMRSSLAQMSVSATSVSIQTTSSTGPTISTDVASGCVV